MDERRARGRRHVLREPGHEPVHLRDGLGLACPVLLRPALHLARHVAFGTPEIGKADRRRVEGVQPREGLVHGLVEGAALGRRRVGQRRHPEHAALDMGHDVKGGADDAVVVAIGKRLGDRKALSIEGRQHPVLAVDRVRRGEELPRRLAAQHVAPRRRRQEIGRVRLPALEHARLDRPFEAVQARSEPGREPRGVEGEVLRHRLRARIGRLAVGGGAHGCGAPRKACSAASVASGASSATKWPESTSTPVACGAKLRRQTASGASASGRAPRVR